MYNFWRMAACGALLSLGVSCQKTDLSPNLTVDTNPAALRSEWVWTGSTGGAGGGAVTPPAGQQESWVFQADGTLTQYLNGQAMRTTTYARATETTLLYHDQREVITVNPGAATPDMRYIIQQLAGDDLVLQEDVFDGYRRTFRRAKSTSGL